MGAGKTPAKRDPFPHTLVPVDGLQWNGRRGSVRVSVSAYITGRYGTIALALSGGTIWDDVTSCSLAVLPCAWDALTRLGMMGEH